ncbi:MAG: TonB-dependent receptor [Hyphomicrobium sp.]|uniref:TonB-dependent receptor n=1 Tax=Hyphomicrobium sp. TaxID=82 RepID=UPI003D0F5823
MMAASPISLAVAQESSSTALPPLKVEAKSGKKKTATKKSTTVSPQPVAAPPAPAPEKPPAEAGANPYANPAAPYMVETSASGKLTQPLVDTPKTVTAVPKEVMEDQGVHDLRDLARNVPGLTIGSAEGGNSYGAFAIRGFKASNDIFVDSIRNPGNVIPDVFSVEQVEIYKGPSGGIAGRSTIGGAINIISKQPHLDESFFEVATTVGTDEMFRTTVDANQVVTPDFAVRANLMYDQHDIAGRDVTDSERWGGLISAVAKPVDGVSVTLDYYRYRNDATPDWGVPVRNVDNVPATELGVIPRDTWVGMKGLDFFNEEADIGTATVVAKLAPGVRLTNRTRVGESRLNYVATSMEGYPDVHHPNRDQTANIYANQTEINARFETGTFRHDLVAGIEVSREEISRSGYNITACTDNAPNAAQQTVCANNGIPLNPRPFPAGLYNPAYMDVILGKGKVYDATIDTIGTYVTDTVHLTDQWIINGGVRFDDFERDQVGGTGAAGTTDPATNTANVQEDLFSWNVGIVYKPIPIASIYAAYGTSESPIGSELDSTGAQYNGISPTLVDVPPQEAESVEIGTKWELFDRRLLATAAVFQTEVDHARTNDGVTPGNDANAFAGKYRVRGIEVSAVGNITDEWSVFGGLQLLDTEVLKSSTAQDVGRRLANIPLVQFALLSKYQLTDKLSVAGSATYGGEVYGGHLAANASNNHTVDWWRFDAFAEYDLTDNIEIEVSGLNLTDELYYDAIYQAADTFAFVAPGRAGYLTVKYKY